MTKHERDELRRMKSADQLIDLLESAEQQRDAYRADLRIQLGLRSGSEATIIKLTALRDAAQAVVDEWMENRYRGQLMERMDELFEALASLDTRRALRHQHE